MSPATPSQALWVVAESILNTCPRSPSAEPTAAAANTISNNAEVGVYLYKAKDFAVLGNTIDSNSSGIECYDGSTSGVIADNTISGTTVYEGIYIKYGSMDLSIHKQNNQ